MWPWELTAVLVCIALSAFFSASETALTAMGPIKTQRFIEQKGRWSKYLVLWRDKPLHVLTCILIGNNIVNITASTLAADVAQKILGQTPYAESAIPIAIGVMTFLVLTFGEITPKTIAKARHEKLASVFMLLLWLPYHAFYPFTVIFTKMTSLIMKAGGAELDGAHAVTEEEIEFLIEMGRRHGSLEGHKERLLLSVFDYDETIVRECMVPRVEITAINRNDALEKIVDTLIESGHSRVPVFDDSLDKIEGVFYAKDLLKVFGAREQASFDIADLLRPVEYVPEQMKISDLLSYFQRSRVHIAVVVDEFGGTSGLITLEDIIEEFFGEIRDEYDGHEEDDIKEESGGLRAAARTPLTEIAEHFEIEFPENQDYDSLGGFVVAQLGSLPDVGAEVCYEDLKMCVTEADEKHVIEVFITRDHGGDDDHSMDDAQPLAV